MNVAIITGASSGIGRAFATQLAARRDVDELWLVARRADRLHQLAESLPKQSRCIAADLSEPEGVDSIERQLEKERPDVTYLISAAGLGKFGDWRTVDVADQNRMIDVNCRAMVDLTVAAIPHMPHGSHILEVVSCAAFMPLPHMSVYAASKAFMQSYVRGLRWELHGTGICATAVCPAWVKTEFMQVAADNAQNNVVRHFPFAQKPRTVARRALRANRLHFAVACCGIVSFLLRIFGKFIPHCIDMAGWEGFRRI